MAGLMLVGCTALPVGEARREHADELAARRGWQRTTLSAGDFALAAWLPSRVTRGEDLSVYIEGDGLAWLDADTPSPDPTPTRPVGLQLALAQPSGNAAYLARPCQYLDRAALAACGERYWTNARFAPEVVEATNRAIDRLKARFGATRLALVGYSGGAAVAALVAARRSDVARLVTVAGNLDVGAWTAWHRVSPLAGSLDPADERASLANLEQWHFVGARDAVVPPALTRHYAAGIGAAHLIVLPGFDHHCCWVEHWAELWERVQQESRPTVPGVGRNSTQATLP